MKKKKYDHIPAPRTEGQRGVVAQNTADAWPQRRYAVEYWNRFNGGWNRYAQSFAFLWLARVQVWNLNLEYPGEFRIIDTRAEA